MGRPVLFSASLTRWYKALNVRACSGDTCDGHCTIELFDLILWFIQHLAANTWRLNIKYWHIERSVLEVPLSSTPTNPTVSYPDSVPCGGGRYTLRHTGVPDTVPHFAVLCKGNVGCVDSWTRVLFQVIDRPPAIARQPTAQICGKETFQG